MQDNIYIALGLIALKHFLFFVYTEHKTTVWWHNHSQSDDIWYQTQIKSI